MSGEKPTMEVDQLAVIRGLLERGAAKGDALEAKVDAMRAEASARGAEQAAHNKSVDAELATIRNEVERHGMLLESHERKFRDVNSDIRELRAQDADVRKQSSEADLEHEAALAGAMTHAQTTDSRLERLEQQSDAHGRELAEQTASLSVIKREMGLESVAGEQPRPALQALDRKLRGSTVVQLIIAIAVIAAFVRQALGH